MIEQNAKIFNEMNIRLESFKLLIHLFLCYTKLNMNILENFISFTIV
jgi:hypothetical protein